jgi:regulator of cell morphogenesis and NO signaling
VNGEGTCGLSFTEHERLSTPQLIAHIVNCHHEYLRTNIPKIARMSEPFPEVHDEFVRLAAELEEHMELEERVIFPAALSGLRRRSPQAAVAIRYAEDDHVAAVEALDRLSKAAWHLPGELAFALREFVHDLFNHILEEDIVLFPRIASAPRR